MVHLDKGSINKLYIQTRLAFATARHIWSKLKHPAAQFEVSFYFQPAQYKTQNIYRMMLQFHPTNSAT
jgi:hypothetical protein